MRWSCSCAMFMLVAALLLASKAAADITTYTDRDAWFEDVSQSGTVPITTIGFTEVPPFTHVTDEYSHLGIVFDGNNRTLGKSTGIFPQDGWGLEGQLEIAFTFDQPRHALAVDFPGDVFFELYNGGEFVDSVLFLGGPSGIGGFGGLTSTQEFDQVTILDPTVPPVFIDDLHFVRIPAPGGLFILPGAVFLFRWRIRRRAARTHGNTPTPPPAATPAIAATTHRPDCHRRTNPSPRPLPLDNLGEDVPCA